jgi:pyruvate dehydrogenase E2 component (dihydrolipoamide acetyltransferase)
MEFRLPDIGEGIAEGEIVTWLVKVGDKVKEDQPLFEVMTDKATVEIPSPRAGIISKLLAKEGEIVPVESVVLIIDEENEQKIETKSEPIHQDKLEKNVDFVLVKDNQSNFISDDEDDFLDSNKKVLATPATRKFARDKGINISKVKATGKNGKVTKDDVLNYLNNKSSNDVKSESKDLIVRNAITQHSSGEYSKDYSKQYSYSEPGKYDEERVPFKGLRKKIAENLLKSIQSAPHFMIADEVDMTELVNFRKECKDMAEKKGVKLTYLPFIIKAVISALKDFPSLNSSLDEEKNELVFKKYYNIGVAVATSQGLIVPVLKNADKKTIFESAKELDRLANQTRDGKIAVDELKGGTFTITNIGSIGGMFSSPIINYPEVAILGVNKIVEKPVVKNGEFVARHMMYLSMSCDHRVVDGAIAALFLNRVIELLQNPKFLLLE